MSNKTYDKLLQNEYNKFKAKGIPVYSFLEDFPSMYNNDYYKFIHGEYLYYRIFYNMIPIHKKCACGKVDADVGTRFIAMDYTFPDGSKSKMIVPDDKKYKILNQLGNPLYGICMVDSETFFEYFLPGDYCISLIDNKHSTNFNKLPKEQWEIIQNISKHIKSKYKDQILNTLDDLSKIEPWFDHFIQRSYYPNDSYDIRLNRHNMYFLRSIGDLYRIMDTIIKIYRRLENNDRGNYKEFQSNQ